MSKNEIPLEISCSVGGLTWNLYSFSYNTEDGKFVGYLHAISDEHASYVLEELRQTAEIDGQIVGSGKA